MRALLAAGFIAVVSISAIQVGEGDALAIDANILARHIPFATLLDPIYASSTSTQIVGYTRCGDSAL